MSTSVKIYNLNYKNTIVINSKTWNCSQRYLHAYIISADCYLGNGTFYRGTSHRTEKGTECQSWAASPRYNRDKYPLSVSTTNIYYSYVYNLTKC